MPHIANATIMDAVKEITVAAVSHAQQQVTAETGKNVADFMQAVYDKLTELARNGS